MKCPGPGGHVTQLPCHHLEGRQVGVEEDTLIGQSLRQKITPAWEQERDLTCHL